jgi:hypothetical protein
MGRVRDVWLSVSGAVLLALVPASALAAGAAKGLPDGGSSATA